MTKEIQKRQSNRPPAAQIDIAEIARQEGIPSTGITIMGGRPYINVTGLDVKLKNKCETEHLIHVKTEAKRIVEPTEENSLMVGYHAEVVLYDRDNLEKILSKIKDIPQEMQQQILENYIHRFSAEGFASPSTCEGIGYKYRWVGGQKVKGEVLLENIFMMAERRATNRAKREATGTGLTSLDELPLENTGPTPKTFVTEPIRASQPAKKPRAVKDDWQPEVKQVVESPGFKNWCKEHTLVNMKEVKTMLLVFHEVLKLSEIEILDKERAGAQFRNLKKSAEALSKETSSTTPSKEELLGLAFKRGEEVKDSVTGKRGKIIAGQRAYTPVSVPGTEGD